MKNQTILGALLILCASGGAQSVREDGKLPGYYEFYLKKGKLQRIGAEQQRDRKIDTGELVAQKLEKPMPALVLPLQTGKMLDLARFKGSKHLLIATYRAWW